MRPSPRARPQTDIRADLVSLSHFDGTRGSVVHVSACNDRWLPLRDRLVLGAIASGKIIACIKRWQAEHDLRAFEYTRHLRVSPTSIPHSHPVLTLNTELHDPNAILCEYLHEQMHWYLTRLKVAENGSPLIAELKRRYPAAPVGFPDGGNDEYSTYLHLLVNWLEIEAASRFAGRDRVEEIARNKHYYRWMYRTVLLDWRPLEELYQSYDVVPIKPAESLLD